MFAKLINAIIPEAEVEPIERQTETKASQNILNPTDQSQKSKDDASQVLKEQEQSLDKTSKALARKTGHLQGLNEPLNFQQLSQDSNAKEFLLKQSEQQKQDTFKGLKRSKRKQDQQIKNGHEEQFDQLRGEIFKQKSTMYRSSQLSHQKQGIPKNKSQNLLVNDYIYDDDDNNAQLWLSGEITETSKTDQKLINHQIELSQQQDSGLRFSNLQSLPIENKLARMPQPLDQTTIQDQSFVSMKPLRHTEAPLNWDERMSVTSKMYQNQQNHQLDDSQLVQRSTLNDTRVMKGCALPQHIIQRDRSTFNNDSGSTQTGGDDIDQQFQQPFQNIFDWDSIINNQGPLQKNQLSSVRNQLLKHSKHMLSRKQRGLLWTKLFNIEETQKNFSERMYSKLVEMPNEEAEGMISRDVSRTLGDLKLWREDLNCGNNKLFNVLKAYANYDNEVSYVQGLNYVVGLMLYYIGDEELVFWCLHNLMQGVHNWRQIYTCDLPKLQYLLSQLETSLKTEFPQVYRLMQENYLEVSGLFSPLFMTLFVYQTQFEVATRLFELFIVDGQNGEKLLIKLTLKMIELTEKKILNMEDALELQKYMRGEMAGEITKQYPLSKLLQD